MYKQPRRNVAARKPLQPSLDLVERRRREQLQIDAPKWHSAFPFRMAAACILSFFASSVGLGLAMNADAGIFSSADPALAEAAPQALRHAARIQTRRHPQHLTVHRR